MDSTVYKFNLKVGLLDEKIFVVRDYFEFYTTGVENLIRENPDMFRFTERRQTERPEVLANDLYKDPNEADVIVAVNNQNYLNIMPFDYDTYFKAKDFRIKYMKYLMKKRYEDISEIIDERVEEDIDHMNELSKLVIVPTPRDLSIIKRKIQDYFQSRKVDYYDNYVRGK